MDVGRRGWIGAAMALGAAALSGCGGGGSLARRCADAASDVEEVTDAELEARTGGTFAQQIAGTIDLDAAGESEVRRVFDEAMRAVVTTIHDEGGDAGKNWRVGRITGTGSDGTEIDPLALDPEWPEGATPGRDALTAAQLYSRYGLS